MASRSVEEGGKGGKPEAARLAISVLPDAPGATRGVLRFAGIVAPCALGRGGIVRSKREGDGGTPAGTWPLRRVLYRADRLRPPVTALPLAAIAPDDGWCDASGHPEYNRPVRHPFPASAERLWREDHVYDLLVPLGYNDAPVRPGAGSAIFFHLAREGYAPTEGCVAIALQDMRAILAAVSPGTVMQIAAAPGEGGEENF